MITFGFSYVGLIFLAMLMVPNIFWAKHQPEGYEESSKRENKVLLAFERAGEVLASCILLIFADTNIRPGSWWIGWLIASFVMMVLYEIYWIRYFRSSKTLADMYSSIAGFPVAGASLPVAALLLLGIYASNIFIIATSLILGIGHIGIHLQHRKDAGIKSGKSKAVKIILAIVQVSVAIPVVLVIVSSVFFIAKRNINYLTNFINPNTGIDEQTYIDINGQKQFISIRGRNRDNPVILYLHGGPLSPDHEVSYTYANDLIDDYTFVCWDQRGCGRTYFANDDRENKTVSFDTALKDTDTLTDYLCTRFGQDKIIIMGHSYGSILGATYVHDHPEKVSAYIGVGQFVNNVLSVTSEYKDALAKAKAAGDDTTYMEKAYEDFMQDPLQFDAEISGYCAQYHPSQNSSAALMTALESPYLATEDLRWFTSLTGMEDLERLGGDILYTCLTVDLTKSVTSYEVPVYFISGGDDWTCSYVTMTDYADQVGAGYKVIEGANHFVQGDKPHEFAQTVRSFLAKSI